MNRLHLTCFIVVGSCLFAASQPALSQGNSIEERKRAILEKIEQKRLAAQAQRKSMTDVQRKHIELLKDEQAKPVQTLRLNAGAQVEDIVSTGTNCVLAGSGDDVMYGFLLGSQLHISRSAKLSKEAAAQSADQWKAWCSGISKTIWKDFGGRGSAVGQATLTVVAQPNGTWDVLTKTIYMPDGEAFTDAAQMNPEAQAFWKTVEAALATINESEFPKTPDVQSVKFEFTIGKDKETFPRVEAFGQQDMMRRSAKGGISIGGGKQKNLRVGPMSVSGNSQ